MNGTQATRTSSSKDISRLDPASADGLQRSAKSFMHPDDVLSDVHLTQAEKREILASWASDIRTVPNMPALRQLDNGAVVRIDDVLRALSSLNESEAAEQTVFNPFRSYAALRVHPSYRPRLPLRQYRSDDDDDDDPPPCPAIAANPLGGPLSGEGAADFVLMLAA